MSTTMAATPRSAGDGGVKITLLDLAGNDMFPDAAMQVSRDASLGQLQRKVMDLTEVQNQWFKGKHLVAGYWVHRFDDAYCRFMMSPQVKQQVQANQLEAMVICARPV